MATNKVVIGERGCKVTKSLGQIAYEAYREAVGNVDYRGEPLSDWDDLSSDKIRNGWDIAADKAVKEFLDQYIEKIFHSRDY